MGVFSVVKLSGYTFACPNCGHRFKRKWYHFWRFLLVKYAMAELLNKINIKCPQCKIKDTCSILELR